MIAADDCTRAGAYVEALRALGAWTHSLDGSTPEENDGIASIFGTLFHWSTRADVVEGHAEARRDGLCGVCRNAGATSTEALLSRIDEVIGELRGDDP